MSGSKTRNIFGGKHANVHTVEYVLGKEMKFLDVEFDDDPRDALKTFNAYVHKKSNFMAKAGGGDDSGSEGEDDREYISNQLFRYKHKTK